MTGQSGLLEAMGAAFGAATGDVARVADYEMVLGGLRNLREDDVRTLRQIRDRHVFCQQTDEEEVAETKEFQTVRRLSVRLGTSPEATAYGLVRLVNQGFCGSTAVLSGTRFEITDLGRLLFDALERLQSPSAS